MKENIYNWSTGTTSTRDLSDAEVAERTLSTSEGNTLNLRRLREERDLKLNDNFVEKQNQEEEVYVSRADAR